MGFFDPFPHWLNRVAHSCCGVCAGVTLFAVLHRVAAVPFTDDYWSGAVEGASIVYGASLLLYLAIRVLRMVGVT